MMVDKSIYKNRFSLFIFNNNRQLKYQFDALKQLMIACDRNIKIAA